MSAPLNKPIKQLKATKAPQKAEQEKHHKYIFVVGGVMSGVGKGIATSSIGTLLQAKGFDVNLAKVDPYLNVDAGTMNPTEHGEVFVLNSGLETDQDMGNYERFLNRDLFHDDYMTSGMVYRSVIEKERNLGYKGKCVEAIPHIRDEIVHRYERAAAINQSEISVIEIGGTVGDYQNIMFIEAARVLKIKHPDDVIFIMVSYLPIPSKIGEMKSRPTQNAVHQLAGYGVYTDIIIARSEVPVDQKRKEKIAIACNILPDHVISAPDIESVYDVPVNFERDKLGDILMKTLKLTPRKAATGLKSLDAWKNFAHGVKAVKGGTKQVHIAIVGKYFNTGDFVLTDAYVSVLEAIKYSAYALGVEPVIHTVNAVDFEKEQVKSGSGGAGSGGPNSAAAKPIGKSRPIHYAALDKYDGILVPGGFGETGIEGKLNVIRYAREKKIPYFGLCYGMQLLTIEYARNVLGLEGANTSEIDPRSPHLVIDIMPDQKIKLENGEYGASMRLGSYDALLKKGTIAHAAYSEAGWVKRTSGARAGLTGAFVTERHRHRYEVNPVFVDRLQMGTKIDGGGGAVKGAMGGLVFSGTSPDGTLMEIAELPRSEHPFFLGTQFHPEFLARPLRPHPLFTQFIKAGIERRMSRTPKEGRAKRSL